MDSKESMERIKFEVSQEMGLSKPVEKSRKILRSKENTSSILVSSGEKIKLHQAKEVK